MTIKPDLHKSHRLTISYYSLSIMPLVIGVMLLMLGVMNTARDRENYIRLFTHPFEPSRIEPGFLWIARGLYLANVPPVLSILLICGAIYLLFAKSWAAYVRLKPLESLLIFNGFVFSVFNYYLGTSIRMGLAAGLCVYAFSKFREGEYRLLWLLTLCSASFIHYGVIPFVVTASWILISYDRLGKFHFYITLFGCALSVWVFPYIVSMMSLGAYYMQYFNSDFGQTGRIIPFSLLFFFLVWFVQTISNRKSLEKSLTFYGLPFALYSLITGNPVFVKILVPFIFLGAADIFIGLRRRYLVFCPPEIRLAFLLIVNVLAILYALRAYQAI